MMLDIPDELSRMLGETPELARAYLVGGCVRDALRGQAVRDYDVEVFGVAYDQLVRALAPWGRTDLVGRSFGVVKLTTRGGATHDFTIARRDSKVAPGHKGFETSFDPDLTPEEAASRRDFTINALMYDPRRREVLDFFGGQADLDHRILRHTSPAFVEDPLRVLRGMQFAARFELQVAPETVELCRSMRPSYAELAVERVREEWFKWAGQSVRPSLGLRFLAETHWIGHFPEVRALIGTPQDPEWHPEGDVFVHTCHCCDALAGLPEWREAEPASRVVYMLAVLAHDFGKPATTQVAERVGRKRIVSPGHEELGGSVAQEFLERIQAPRAIQERVIPLVANHLAHVHSSLTDRAVRRLARRLVPENIRGLCLVMTADHYGRPPMPAGPPSSIHQLKFRAEALSIQDNAPQPFLMGRHLVDLGLPPGRAFGPILDAAYDQQLEGTITDLNSALRWLGTQTEFPLPREVLARLPGA